MKTLALTLLTLSLMFGASAAEAAIRVKVGPVRVAAGRRVARPVVRPAYVAPRPVRAANLANLASYRQDTVQDIREERFDTFQDVVEERVDTVRDFREERRQAAWDWLLSN